MISLIVQYYLKLNEMVISNSECELNYFSRIIFCLLFIKSAYSTVFYLIIKYGPKMLKNVQRNMIIYLFIELTPSLHSSTAMQGAGVYPPITVLQPSGR